MLPDDVRCRSCGHIGPAGYAHRTRYELRSSLFAYLHERGDYIHAVHCCERCQSDDITDRPACVHCGLRDATDEDYCHTCAVAIETTDVLCASRAGIERISDLDQTVRECARGLR